MKKVAATSGQSCSLRDFFLVGIWGEGTGWLAGKVALDNFYGFLLERTSLSRQRCLPSTELMEARSGQVRKRRIHGNDFLWKKY
jgi:hypothetical protein